MTHPTTTTGLLHAYLLDGRGGGRLLSWEEARNWSPDDGDLWLHMDYTDPAVIDWLQHHSELHPLAAEALLTEESRPRVTAMDEGVLMALRGVNLNPGSDPEDMVSIRLWADRHRVISTRRRYLLSVHDVKDQLAAGKGPTDSADLIVKLTDRLVWRMSDTVDGFEDEIADMEEHILAESHPSLRYDLATLRRQTISIRRYLSPQREAIARLINEKISWLDEAHRLQLREISDRLIRHIEDIDAVRDRASVTQEELMSRTSEKLEQRMYVLSIITAVFLPLGFFTGLLGINVGGIPGSENPHAFTVVIGLLLAVILLQLLLFWWKKWL